MTKEEIRKEMGYTDPGSSAKNIKKALVFSNEFERDYDYLSTFDEKLSYAMAEFCGGGYTLNTHIKCEEIFKRDFVPLLKNLIGADEINWDKTVECFIVYADSVERSEDGYPDLHKLKEVPSKDIVYDDEGSPEEMSRSGRAVETVFVQVGNFGSIDHQSAGLLRRFMEKYDVSLKDFLTRKDIVVIVDGDESCIFSRMLKDGIINRDNLEAVYPGR